MRPRKACNSLHWAPQSDRYLTLDGIAPHLPAIEYPAFVSRTDKQSLGLFDPLLLMRPTWPLVHPSVCQPGLDLSFPALKSCLGVYVTALFSNPDASNFQCSSLLARPGSLSYQFRSFACLWNLLNSVQPL